MVEALPILEARPLRDSDRPPLIISKLASSVNESFSFLVIGKALVDEGVTLPTDGDGDFGQGEEEVVGEEMGGTGLLYDEVTDIIMFEGAEVDAFAALNEEKQIELAAFAVAAAVAHADLDE